MFRPPSHNIPRDVIESIVKNHNPNGRNVLREAAEQYYLQVDEQARAAGFPEEVIEALRARRARPSLSELARSMFPVDPLPTGALPIYDRELLDSDDILDPDD